MMIRILYLEWRDFITLEADAEVFDNNFGKNEIVLDTEKGLFHLAISGEVIATTTSSKEELEE